MDDVAKKLNLHHIDIFNSNNKNQETHYFLRKRKIDNNFNIKDTDDYRHETNIDEDIDSDFECSIIKKQPLNKISIQIRKKNISVKEEKEKNTNVNENKENNIIMNTKGLNGTNNEQNFSLKEVRFC